MGHCQAVLLCCFFIINNNRPPGLPAVPGSWGLMILQATSSALSWSQIMGLMGMAEEWRMAVTNDSRQTLLTTSEYGAALQKGQDKSICLTFKVSPWKDTRNPQISHHEITLPGRCVQQAIRVSQIWQTALQVGTNTTFRGGKKTQN